MREMRGRVREYIEKMNKISVIIIIAGTVIAGAALLLAVILPIFAKSAQSPARLLLIADELFNTGATIFLTAPIIALILDLFFKSMNQRKE